MGEIRDFLLIPRLTLESLTADEQILLKEFHSFPNGIIEGSSIDRKRLLRKAEEHNPCFSLPEGYDQDSFLKKHSVSCGNRIYAWTVQQTETLRQILEKIAFQGYSLFSFDVLFEKHKMELTEIHIYNSKMLKNVISREFQNVYVGRSTGSFKKDVTLANEIDSCFCEEQEISMEQIFKIRPYLYRESIKMYLSSSPKYVRLSAGTYISTDSIEFSEADVIANLKLVDEQVKKYGYISLVKLCFPNHYLFGDESEKVLREAFYFKHLQDQYDKYRLILVKKGEALNTNEIIKAYVNDKKMVTIAELKAYEKDLSGDIHNVALKIAMQNMIRIDANTFVKRAGFFFDTEKIDAILDDFVKGFIAPLRSIGSFISFPPIPEYNWNPYLLESYLHLYSRKYTVRYKTVNCRLFGTICSADLKDDEYKDLMAKVLLRNQIDLETEAAGDYLFQSGYLGRRTEFINDILTSAAILKEEGWK